MLQDRFFAFLLLLSVISSVAAAPVDRLPVADAAWSTHGPASGGVSALAVDPADPVTLYASTPLQGLLKSDDAGDHWRQINRFGSGTFFGPFALSPSRSKTLYAFESNDLYRTDDGGESWVAGGRVPDAGLVNLVVVDPTDPLTVYAAATQSLGHGIQHLGLFKSRDAGQSWFLLPLSGSLMLMRRLLVNPAAPSVLYAVVGQGYPLYRSRDGGESWEAVSPASYGAFEVALDPTDRTSSTEASCPSSAPSSSPARATAGTPGQSSRVLSAIHRI